MFNYGFVFLAILQVVTFGVLFWLLFSLKAQKSKDQIDTLSKIDEKLSFLSELFQKIESSLKSEFKENRAENAKESRENRGEFSQSFKELKTEVGNSLKLISDGNTQTFSGINQLLQSRIDALIEKVELSHKSSREELSKSFKEFGESQKVGIEGSIQGFQVSFDRNVEAFNNLQKEKLSSLDRKQSELLVNTENHLNKIRSTVEEKLEKTLNDRLTQSFETVSNHLISVQ